MKVRGAIEERWMEWYSRISPLKVTYTKHGTLLPAAGAHANQPANAATAGTPGGPLLMAYCPAQKAHTCLGHWNDTELPS